MQRKVKDIFDENGVRVPRPPVTNPDQAGNAWLASMLTVDERFDDTIASQFQNEGVTAAQPNEIETKDLFKALFGGLDDTAMTLEDLLAVRNVDDAEGVWLDVIGSYVGFPRPAAPPIDESTIFEFTGGIGRGYTGIDEPEKGGYWYGLEYENLIYIPVDDEVYRQLIRGAIVVTHGNSSSKTINEFFHVGFDRIATLTFPQPAVLQITLNQPVSSIEREAIGKLLPVASGVTLLEISYSSFPEITQHPVNEVANIGETFTLESDGDNSATIQWFKDGAPISGAGDKDYTISNFQAGDIGAYYVEYTNSDGTTRSSTAAVTAYVPTFIDQPVGGRFVAGQEITISFTGIYYDTIKWFKNDVEMVGQTTESLVFTPAYPADNNAKIKAVISSGFAQTDSDIVTISLKDATDNLWNSTNVAGPGVNGIEILSSGLEIGANTKAVGGDLALAVAFSSAVFPSKIHRLHVYSDSSDANLFIDDKRGNKSPVVVVDKSDPKWQILEITASANASSLQVMLPDGDTVTSGFLNMELYAVDPPPIFTRQPETRFVANYNAGSYPGSFVETFIAENTGATSYYWEIMKDGETEWNTQTDATNNNYKGWETNALTPTPRWDQWNSGNDFLRCVAVTSEGLAYSQVVQAKAMPRIKEFSSNGLDKDFVGIKRVTDGLESGSNLYFTAEKPEDGRVCLTFFASRDSGDYEEVMPIFSTNGYGSWGITATKIVTPMEFGTQKSFDIPDFAYFGGQNTSFHCLYYFQYKFKPDGSETLDVYVEIPYDPESGFLRYYQKVIDDIDVKGTDMALEKITGFMRPSQRAYDEFRERHGGTIYNFEINAEGWFNYADPDAYLKQYSTLFYFDSQTSPGQFSGINGNYQLTFGPSTSPDGQVVYWELVDHS